MAAMLERIEKPGMTAHVAFPQQLGQVFLGPSSRAVDGAVVVAPFAGLAVAAEEDAHEPPVPPAPQFVPSCEPTQFLSKIWHTAGTLVPTTDLSDQLQLRRLTDRPSRASRATQKIHAVPGNRLGEAVVTKDVVAA